MLFRHLDKRRYALIFTACSDPDCELRCGGSKWTWCKGYLGDLSKLGGTFPSPTLTLNLPGTTRRCGITLTLESVCLFAAQRHRAQICTAPLACQRTFYGVGNAARTCSTLQLRCEDTRACFTGKPSLSLARWPRGPRCAACTLAALSRFDQSGH